MRVLIAAVCADNIIGVNDDLPWPRIPADMALFKRVTKDQIVVMGRKTWESLPTKYKPLPDRINAVVTRDTSFNPGTLAVEILSGFSDAYLKQLENKYPGKDIYIIGGADIYNTAIDHALIDEALITRVHYTVDMTTSIDPQSIRRVNLPALSKLIPLQTVTPLTNEPVVCFLEAYAQLV